LNTDDRLTPKAPLNLTKSNQQGSAQVTLTFDHTQKFQQVLGTME
jgi:hypothetical protein